MKSLGRFWRGAAVLPIALSCCSRTGGEPSKPHSTGAEQASPSPLVDATPSARQHPQPGDGTAPAAEVADVCAELRRQGAYVSRVDFECGPPLEGRPAPRCHSRIEFSEGTYQWRHTDMVFTGTYTCEGFQIRGDEHHGTFDPETGHLRWEGVEYVPATDP